MRDKRYDGLRGLFLIIMCIDHFQSSLMHVTHETFGFIDAA
ncbi:MAG: OpgC domain-containing protein [Cyclobacteriaceae bacterium]|nr:OpgC domain-containing protein [Cyclobacteriaceae bacterium]